MLLAIACVLLASRPPTVSPVSAVGEPIIYKRIAELDIPDTGQGPKASIPLSIQGSADLKLAFLARATGGISTIPLNMFDAKAGDNTTPKAYVWVDDTWRPLMYRCDRFRYNAVADSTVRSGTDYTNLLFHGSKTPNQSGLLQLRSLVIYRGLDTEPPKPPTGLAIEATRDGIRLSWQPSVDNVGIAGYVVSRSGKEGGFTKVGQPVLPEYLDRPPAPGSYVYRVSAIDFENNVSTWSETRSLQVEQAFPAPGLTVYEQDRLNYAAHIRTVHAAGRGNVTKGLLLQYGDSLSGALNYQRFTEGALGRDMVEARGRAGWTTRQGRTAIASDIKELNPEICLILFGTNNSKSRFAIDEAMDDVLAMVKACEANGTVAILATIPPRGFTDPASQPEANYNVRLIDTCRKNEIPVAYLFEEFQAQPDRKKLLAVDGVHWGEGGFPIAALAWKKAVEQVMYVLLDQTNP